MNFEDPAPPASGEAIAEVESALDVRFPENYRRFLGHQNGGYLEPNVLPGDLGASVRCLYSAGETPVEGLEDLVSVAQLYGPEGEADDELRAGLLPIGEDEGGNLICLDVDGDDPGSVYFWEHEIEPQNEAYTRLADDVDALIAAPEPRSR